MTSIQDTAMELVGTPFHWGGRKPGIGLDCAGVIILSAGGRIEDWRGYGATTNTAAIIDRLIPQLIKVDGDPEPGDILVFWMRQANTPVHLGVMTEDGMIVHSHKSVDQCVREPLERWRRRLFGVYRVA